MYVNEAATLFTEHYAPTVSTARKEGARDPEDVASKVFLTMLDRMRQGVRVEHPRAYLASARREVDQGATGGAAHLIPRSVTVCVFPPELPDGHQRGSSSPQGATREVLVPEYHRGTESPQIATIAVCAIGHLSPDVPCRKRRLWLAYVERIEGDP